MSQSTLAVALLLVGCIGAGITGCVVAFWNRRTRATLIPLLLLSVLLVPPGCGAADDAGEPVPLDVTRSFGRPGRGAGQFVYPRALAVDRSRGIVYVIDKTARIQSFDRDGTYRSSWTMPDFDDSLRLPLSRESSSVRVE